MIVWLASYPRSGNTFLRILLNDLYDFNTYSIHNNDRGFKKMGCSEIFGFQDINMSIKEMAESKHQLFFVKTHYLPSDNYPAIYLVRDGRDALVSYSRYQLNIPKRSFKLYLRKIGKKIMGRSEYKETLRKLIESSGEDFGFGSWSENVKQWKSREKKPFIIKYEDLVKNPVDCVKKAIGSLEIEEGCQGLLEKGKNTDSYPSFDELHEKWPNFFRKGKIGAWREEMSQELQELFWEFHGEVMEEFGYKK